MSDALWYATALRDRAQQQPGSGLAGLQAAIARAEAAIAARTETQSPLVLGDRGVDYIAELGAFAADSLELTSVTRTATARAYLLAPRWRSAVPAIPGLSDLGYLTPEALWSQPDALPANCRLAVVGATGLAVSLAQSCQRLGWSVTLLVPQLTLPTLDRSVAYLLQAQLEADGVRVLTRSPVTQARALDGQTWLQAGDQAIAVDAVVLASGEVPDFAGWQLGERVALLPNGQVRVNAYLQTSQPQIFACRRSDPAIATVEAAIASHNARHRRRRRMSYRALPIALPTQPPLAAVGWPEDWARRCLGNAVVTATAPAQWSSQALLLETTTGCCKLVAHRNGELLGAHACGWGAEEWIGAIALAMQQGLRVADLAALTVPQPSGSELVPLVAQAWLARAGT